jgi:phytol kinase
MNIIFALITTFVLALFWLRINNFFAHKGWISSELSRKIIHIGTGPIFVLCWLLYPDLYYSRFVAAIVPFVITVQFILVGLGIVNDKSAIESMSRTGDRKEILRGPLLYGIAFVVLTLLFWRESPVGMTALMILCGGDGLADILGRKFGKVKLPWNNRKSWIGSLGMFLGGLFLSVPIIFIFNELGYFDIAKLQLIVGLIIISLISTIVESLSPSDTDNITIPLFAVFVGILIW